MGRCRKPTTEKGNVDVADAFVSIGSVENERENLN